MIDGRFPDYQRVIPKNADKRLQVDREHLRQDLKPVWVSYLRVEDPAAITARVAELGGRVIVEAQPRPAGGTVAFVADPSGAGIALQTWPLTDSSEAAQ